MKREALEKINRRANEMSLNPGADSQTAMIQRVRSGTARKFWHSFGTVKGQNGRSSRARNLEVLYNE